MAKSDLLKEAIADARAVKETAIANAKIALEEAFAPRIQSMLGAKLAEQMEEEEEELLEPGAEDMAVEPGMEDEMPAEDEMGMDMPDSVGVAIDLDNDGSYDYEGDLGQGGVEDEMPGEEMPGEEMPGDMDAEAELDSAEGEMDDDLAEIIRELEEGMYEEGMYEEEETVEEQVKDEAGDDGDGFFTENVDSDIDAIIEAILAEEEDSAEEEKEAQEKEDEKDLKEAELNEAYNTIHQLRSVINEVNLLNAKLLYTNKLFRNYELNEAQKMKVIENFDRAGTTREVKLVFSTLAESLKKPAQKRRVVKESYASKPAPSTAPSKETKTQILSEGNELANRWKKLAGLN